MKIRLKTMTYLSIFILLFNIFSQKLYSASIKTSQPKKQMQPSILDTQKRRTSHGRISKERPSRERRKTTTNNHHTQKPLFGSNKSGIQHYVKLNAKVDYYDSKTKKLIRITQQPLFIKYKDAQIVRNRLVHTAKDLNKTYKLIKDQNSNPSLVNQYFNFPHTISLVKPSKKAITQKILGAITTSYWKPIKVFYRENNTTKQLKHQRLFLEITTQNEINKLILDSINKLIKTLPQSQPTTKKPFHLDDKPKHWGMTLPKNTTLQQLKYDTSHGAGQGGVVTPKRTTIH